jgi:hypothetical protein
MKPKSPFEPIFASAQSQVPPAFRDQFLLSEDDPHTVLLAGRMKRVWHNPQWLGPLFWLIGKLGGFVPYQGEDIASSVRITAGTNAQGEPTHVFERHLEFRKPYDFNSVMLWDGKQDALADIIGLGGVLYFTYTSAFTPPDTFTFETKRMAIRLGNLKLWLPRWIWRPMFGKVYFHQKALSDTGFEMDLVIKHPLFGDFFGYEGVFEVKKISK